MLVTDTAYERGRQERSIGWVLYQPTNESRACAHAQLHARGPRPEASKGPRPRFPQPSAASTLSFCWTSLSKCQVTKYSCGGINQVCSSSCIMSPPLAFPTPGLVSVYLHDSENQPLLQVTCRSEGEALMVVREGAGASSPPCWCHVVFAPSTFLQLFLQEELALPTSAPAGDTEATAIPELFSQHHNGPHHRPIRNPIFCIVLSTFASYSASFLTFLILS